jgi:hypothetical protein
MMTLLKKIIYNYFPVLGRIYGAIFNKRGYFTFSGWGLTTTTSNPPWINLINYKASTNNIFLKIDQLLRKKIIIEQSFKTYETSLYKNLSEFNDRLDYLKWRHYIFYITALIAAKNTNNLTKKLVEVGVADGVGAFYAINALKNFNINYKCYLFDSWKAMKKKYLTKKELATTEENKYENLDFDRIKNNFNSDKNIFFIKGFVPESFYKYKKMKNITWLCIDLNSSKPTLKTLKFFYKKLTKNGIILLDDYAGSGYPETKLVVDRFFFSKKSIVFPIPTGQAIIIKN